MKSFLVILLALFAGATAYEIDDVHKSQPQEKNTTNVNAASRDGDDDSVAFGAEDSSEDLDQRKKIYFQQTELQRRLQPNSGGKNQRRRAKKSSKISLPQFIPFRAPPVSRPALRPVSSPVAAPVGVSYVMPVTRPSSPQLSAPVAVNIGSFSSSERGIVGTSGSSRRYFRGYRASIQQASNAPVQAPSASGSIYVQATAEDCRAVSNGQLVEGQSSMTSSRFTFGFNLVLNNGSTNLATVIATARVALQALVAQQIVRCGSRRRLQRNRRRRHRRGRRILQELDDNVIGNANFTEVDCTETTPCSVPGTCYDCSTNVELSLKGNADTAALEQEIEDSIDGPALLANSELGDIADTFSASKVVSLDLSATQIGGDPHIITWKGEHYEYHGQCDMIMVKDENFADGVGLDIHIRTRLVRYWSYIKNVSIRIGSDVLEIVGNPDINSRDAWYWFNYEYKGEMTDIAGYPISYVATSGSKSTYTIDLSKTYPGAKIVIKIYKEFLRVKLFGEGNVYGNSVGLLGNYYSGETLGRDGVTVFHDFYKLANDWQVIPADPKLFQSLEKPQFPDKCLEPDDPLGDRRRRLDEGSISEEEAEKACATLKDPLNIKDCVYDILATQDIDMVGAF